jgi:predicted O-linked N-acetylglucosamine transferase (SPINDLY family)
VLLDRLFAQRRADALIADGNRAETEGRLAEACELYRQAVRRAPRYAKAYLNLGAALEASGNIPAAIASYETARERDPANPYANYNLGRLQHASGALAQAEQLLGEALRLRPQFPEARVVLAAVLETSGRAGPAVLQLEAALRERPQDFGALFRYAALLRMLGRLEEAQAALQRALGVDPQSVEARAALADLLFERGNLGGAARELEALLEGRPDWADAHYNYGCVLTKLMRVSEAESALRRAVALDPRHAGAYRMLGSVLLGQSRIADALELYRSARALCPDDLDLQSAELFALNASESISDEALFRRHADFGARLERAHPARFALRNTRDPERPLRVGYVSGDFGYHVMTLFSLPLIERHDRASCQVFCYSTSKRTDEFTRRVSALADAWRPVAPLSQAQLAEAIHADGIDILVDLGGHTGIPHLAAFAQRPAPVQVAWLGYLNTTGMTRMHFRITDHEADPPGLTDALHTEKLLRLPHCQWCYRSFLPETAVGPSPFARNGYLTFGSFNQAVKLSPTSRALWAELLRRLPEARLAVLGVPKGRAQDELLRDLTARGASAGRITLVPYVSLQDYFGWLGGVDLALDTTPYSGGTTTCDALWMGVPVITAPGTRPCSRSAASIMASVGLTDWIAAGPDEYLQRAADFAQRPQALAELRASLRERMRSSPLMDEQGFTRSFERVYRDLWRRWCVG